MKVKTKIKKKVTKKDQKQPTILNFFERNKENENYFTTYKESAFPASCTGDLTVESILHISLIEDEKLLTEDQITSKIELNCLSKHVLLETVVKSDALQQIDKVLYQNNLDSEQVRWNLEEITSKDTENSLNRTENRHCGNESDSKSEECVLIKNSVEDKIKPLESKVRNKSSVRRVSNRPNKRKVICPKYKIIEGSTFAVDAFRYGEISGVSHYFLTHFHADHYIGLTKKFQNQLFLSEITAKLVIKLIGVGKEYLNIVRVHEPFYVLDARIIPMDANQ